MRIRRKVACFAAVTLPLAGLAVLGGTQVANAAGPTLSCNGEVPDANAYGGLTFGSSGPGQNGIYLNSNQGATETSAGKALEAIGTLDQGATQIEIGNQAITDQVISITGAAGAGDPSGNYTITGDSTPAPGITNPTTVGIYPPLSITTGTTLKAPDVTIDPTTNVSNDESQDGDIADVVSGSTTLTLTTAETIPAGTPISSSTQFTNNDSQQESVIAGNAYIVSGSGTSYKMSLPAPTTSSGAELTTGSEGTIAFVSGLTSYQDNIFNECTASSGAYGPTQATLTTTGAATNSALSLEGKPSTLTGTLTLPAIGSGWTDPEAVGSAEWSTSKDIGITLLPGPCFLNTASTCADTTVYEGGGIGTDAVGTVESPSPYTDAKAEFSEAASGMVVCTAYQTEAIVDGTGPDVGTDGGGLVEGANPLLYCDGGPDSTLPSYSDAFGELESLEISPNSNVTGSDGSSLAAIWLITFSPAGSPQLHDVF
jgi:hypothetical protein